MTERRPRPQMPAFVKALVAMMFGILAGGAFNFMLGDQGADTPAFAIYGGVAGARDLRYSGQASITEKVTAGDHELATLGRRPWAGDHQSADGYLSRRSVQLFHLWSGNPPRDR